jgi:hypothetical protein
MGRCMRNGLFSSKISGFLESPKLQGCGMSLVIGLIAEIGLASPKKSGSVLLTAWPYGTSTHGIPPKAKKTHHGTVPTLAQPSQSLRRTGGCPQRKALAAQPVSWPGENPGYGSTDTDSRHGLTGLPGRLSLPGRPLGSSTMGLEAVRPEREVCMPLTYKVWEEYYMRGKSAHAAGLGLDCFKGPDWLFGAWARGWRRASQGL